MNKKQNESKWDILFSAIASGLLIVLVINIVLDVFTIHDRIQCKSQCPDGKGHLIDFSSSCWCEKEAGILVPIAEVGKKMEISYD